MLKFQQIILKLQSYWDAQGCALLQPYDMEVGAGTSHTATFLRVPVGLQLQNDLLECQHGVCG